MARAMWKGMIRWETLRVPVKLYAGVEDRKVHFRLLHEKDHEPVVQKMIDPRTMQPVTQEEIVRAYELEDGRVVMLTEEELAALVPAKSRDIEILRFFEPEAIQHEWYDRPYWLAPDGESDRYFTLIEALHTAGAAAIVRWTMRNKSYCGALRTQEGYLQVITLRYAEQVVDVSRIPRPEYRALEPQEIGMAQQLVNALESDFDPTAYRDEYRHRVAELVQAKAQGRAIAFRKPEPQRPQVVSLAEMLKQSIDLARKERKRA